MAIAPTLAVAQESFTNFYQSRPAVSGTLQSSDGLYINRAGTSMKATVSQLPASGSTNYIHNITVSLSAAQILNLTSTPVSVLPAPGSNLYYFPLMVTFQFTYNTTTYVVGSGTPAVTLDFVGNTSPSQTGPYAVFYDVSSLSQSDAFLLNCYGLFNPPVFSEFINAALVLDNPGGTYSAGDGTVKYTLFYFIINASTGAPQ